MTPRRRWSIVAAVVLLLASMPYAVSLIPTAHSDISASALLSRITASATIPFSGYSEANGAIGLPDVHDFGDLAALVGGTSDLRIWWRAPKDWRVDAVSATGEQDIHQDAKGLWNWDFERERATRVDFTVAPAARLLRADDLAPGSIARRLLDQATPAEVRRIGDARIAGNDAAGLELVPVERASTISRVDVWALPSSGLPLQVEVYGRSGSAVLTTQMLDLSTATPAPAATSYTPPGGLTIESDQVTDVISAVNQFVVAKPPPRLAGFARASGSTAALGSVGVYGRGVTAFVALPLPAQFADDVEGQLTTALKVRAGGAETGAIGPVTLRLTAPEDNGSRWLLAGTVTASTFARAEPALPPVQDFRR